MLLGYLRYLQGILDAVTLAFQGEGIPSIFVGHCAFDQSLKHGGLNHLHTGRPPKKKIDSPLYHFFPLRVNPCQPSSVAIAFCYGIVLEHLFTGEGQMHQTRKSGILLHPTSLPGPGGIGCLGSECRQFIDFLQQAGQTLWQVLPLGPPAYGNSPYSSFSAFAGNPLLIDLSALVRVGDLNEADLHADFPADRVDFSGVQSYKLGLLNRAAETFFAGGDSSRREEFRRFCETTPWLHDYALFTALKEAHEGKSWRQWPEGIARRAAKALDEQAALLAPVVEIQKYMQWQFFRQWRKIKEYANENGIEIVGDIPIFVAYDSVDVWANPHLFHLDDCGRPLVVAGVPPDYFSKTGQLWGNPLYNWEVMSFQGFSWWIERMRHSLLLYDRVRIDHFRGF